MGGDIVYSTLKDVGIKDWIGALKMNKCVYKITNNINGKIYIGQTNNLKRRLQEHKHDKRMNHPIHNAIVKYGWENFSVEVLYYGDCYNGLEKYFIRQYRSNEKEFGYNIQNGGQDSGGENNPVAILKQTEIDNMIQDLINTDLSYDEIAQKYGVNQKYVTNVNKGASWRNTDLYEYPLRRMIRRMDDESINEVIKLLQNPDIPFDDIERLTGVKRHTIININNGTHWRRPNISYPIREFGLPSKTRDKIIDLLKSSELTVQEIANECGIDRGEVYRVNSGQYHRRTDCTYPIRKLSTKRNELGQYESGFQS